MEISQLYVYDESSPSCLRWAVDIYSGRWKNFKNVSVGDVAGSINSSGYYQVRKEGRLILVHRIIWELHFGPIEQGMFIDHIDGDKTNNKLSNLRVVDRKGNARNCTPRRDNTSGKVGVNLCVNTQRSGNKSYLWRAVWSDLDGKLRSKSFNVRKYGYENAYNLAVEYRQKMIDELNSLGAGYTERHHG
tara:strand:+ start:35170 stop:35736 length:567 start_codon:yes stop_codon:yes gene_type:complete